MTKPLYSPGQTVWRHDPVCDCLFGATILHVINHPTGGISYRLSTNPLGPQYAEHALGATWEWANEQRQKTLKP